MSSPDLQSFVAQIRAEQRLTDEVPGFDPGNGNAAARFLFVLEAPGPRAVETGVVSFENPDATARNFRAQLAAAGVARADIAIWNVVPCYLGESDRSRIRPAIGRDIAVGVTRHLSEAGKSAAHLWAIEAHAIALRGCTEPSRCTTPSSVARSSPHSRA